MFELTKGIRRVLLALMAVAAVSVTAPAHASGQEAPDFTLRDINGESVTLSKLRGEVVLLQFWATWCTPCKAEMPHLNKMQAELKDKGFRVLSINTDNARKTSQVRTYVKGRGYTMSVLLDTESTVVGQYQPSKSIPYAVLISRKGRIAETFTGYKQGDEVHVREAVMKLLGGK